MERIVQYEGRQNEELERRPLLNHFFNILTDVCKIRKPFSRVVHEERNSIEIKIRQLYGYEILQIFKTLNENGSELSNFFSKKKPNTDDFEPIFAGFNLDQEDMVWSGFYDLYNSIHNFPDPENPLDMNNFRIESKNWTRDFLNMRGSRSFPYLHAIASHIPDMLEKHLNLNLFNQQGAEKLNDFIRIYFFRSTNKNRSHKKYLYQLLEKRNRIEFFYFGIDLNQFSETENMVE